MFSVATWTAARRLRAHANALRSVVISCFAGASVAIAIIVGMPTLSRDVRTLVAVSGIVLGGTMTAATLTGRRLSDGPARGGTRSRRWLSIGATPRQAVRDDRAGGRLRGARAGARPDPDGRAGHAARRIRRRAARRARARPRRRGSRSWCWSGCCARRRSRRSCWPTCWARRRPCPSPRSHPAGGDDRVGGEAGEQADQQAVATSRSIRLARAATPSSWATT